MYRTSQLFRVIAVLVLGLSSNASIKAQEQLFSGPQVGEKLNSFKVRGVFDDEAGKDLDFVGQADGKPIVLIFVHDVNRQSVSMTRILSGYTVSRANDGLATGVVWLDDDATAAENQLKKMRHALTPKAPTGISLEGREGPGSYGLNRNVMLTILVGKEGKVTANFALVQPSLQVDLPKILQSVVDIAGGEVPKLSELPGMPDMRRESPQNEAPNLRPLLTPLIRLTASEADVEKAAKAIEDKAAENDAVRKEVGRIANTIVDNGKLESYGTPKAQEYLAKWAKEYGKQRTDAPEDKNKPKAESPKTERR
ncbi:MAG: hypothetical protein SFV81_28695 [Pirellulaceae bacterium]|nr:hypothetical protein [Pirellulaceae bacterium]